MIPSESQLAAAVDSLRGKWARFERVGTTFVRLAPEFGDRFSALEIRGREGEVPVSRWPDAVVERANGSWDCVEVTHSPRWRRHLDRDLARIRDLSVSGFVLVAWCPQPSQAELIAARDDLVAAGVPAGAIEFVFRGRLLESLRQPRFAQVWHELGVPFVPHPFRFVDVDRGLVGVDAGGEEMHPTPEEFRSGQVHAPRTLGRVLGRLEHERFAEVRGRGAAGKTVLAEHVIRRHQRHRNPAYYLKLGAFEQVAGGEGPVQAFSQLAAPNSLFVIDDVHLNPQVARDLRRAWRDHGNGCSMLQLGREQHLYGGWDRAADKDSAQPPIRLTVEAEDLIGVLRRVVKARAGGAEPPDPPPTETRRWLDLFRGDLVVFSAAVAARWATLLRGKWRIAGGDAAWLARKRYLPPTLDQAEREDLLLLALLGDKELGVPIGAVRSGVPRSLEVGAVLRVSNASAGPGEFRLVHPGVGRILLAAHGELPPLAGLVDWARADLVFALRLGLFLRERGDDGLAARVWRPAVASPRGFGSALFALPPQTIDDVLEGLDALGLLAEEQLDDRLSPEAKEIAGGLLEDMHRFAGAFWQLRRLTETRSQLIGELPRVIFAGRVDLARLFGSRPTSRVLERMPEARAKLRALLAADRGLSAKVARGVLAGEVDHLARATQVLSRIARPVEQELRRLILEPETRGRFVAAGAEMNAEGLVGLLRFAHGVEPALGESLERAVPAAGKERLVEVLRVAPGMLRGFENNGWVSPLLAELARSARERGVDQRPEIPARPQLRFRPEVATTLERDPRRALRIDLDSVVRFVGVRHRAPCRAAVADAVRRCLEAEENRGQVVRGALEMDLDNLNRFLAWSEASAPQLHAAARAELGEDARLAARIDSCIEEGSLDGLAALLSSLERVETALKDKAVRLLTEPGRMDRVASAGFRASPCSWVGLLRHEGIPRPFLARLDRRRWDEFWQAFPSDHPYWARSLRLLLRVAGSEDLQRAPAEYVFETTRRDWHCAHVTLRNLSNALYCGGGLGDERTLSFLEQIEHRSFLASRYPSASVWSIARFVDDLYLEQSPAVVETLLTNELWRRLRAEIGVPWEARTIKGAAGFLALIGALSLVGVRSGTTSPTSAQVAEVLVLGEDAGTELDRGQALVRIGLKQTAAA